MINIRKTLSNFIRDGVSIFLLTSKFIIKRSIQLLPVIIFCIIDLTYTKDHNNHSISIDIIFFTSAIISFIDLIQNFLRFIDEEETSILSYEIYLIIKEYIKNNIEYTQPKLTESRQEYISIEEVKEHVPYIWR